ncbi:hypothetical protein ACT3SP_17590 [Brachybacterium sp. AOP43-C2-M15]|uniref:hypothetical protein n=1 Tax=Brachybacterium sp. AOP43-C2-M15 TaxID=3457661 RepID=UPI004033A9C0
MTTQTTTRHPRRRRRTIGICAALALSLAAGLGLWARSDGFRIAREIGDLSGVASAELERGEGAPSERILRVEIAPATGETEIERILEATEAMVDDETAYSARVSLGTAEVAVGSRYRAGIHDAVQALMALSTLPDGRAVLDDREIVFDDADGPPLVNILEWLTVIEEEDLRVENVKVTEEEGRNAISIHRLRTDHREVLQALGEWGPDITFLRLEGAHLEIRTSLPLQALGPLAEDAQSAARALDPESPRVSLETSDRRTLSVGDEDPGTALEMAGEVEAGGWSVQWLNSGVTAIDVTASEGSAADPSLLPDLAETLRTAGLPREASIRVDEGALFRGTLSDLEDLAPTIAQVHADGYVVRWMREDRRPGPDARVRVEMPAGHSLSEDSDLAAAIDAARSVPWPGTGAITLTTTPEAGSSEDSREVTLRSAATGTAEDVQVDPDHLPGADQVQEAWDATSTEG